MPWRRAWQPTPVCLPGGSHGQRSLEGYSPQGRTESNMAEETQHSTRTFLPMIKVSGKNDSSGIGQKDLFWGGWRTYYGNSFL